MTRALRPLFALAQVSALLLGAAGCKRSQPAPAVAPASDSASLVDPGPPSDPGAACADRNPLKNVYFGDLHVHTGYSLDAYAVATRSDPRDAYRFARGQSPVRIGAAAKAPDPRSRSIGRSSSRS